MWTRFKALKDRLSTNEMSSLKELSRGSNRPSIPFQHAERLIMLGLAELSLGRLDLTIPGRQILGTMLSA